MSPIGAERMLSGHVGTKPSVRSGGRRVLAALIAVLAAVGLAACGDGDDQAPSEAAAPASAIAVAIAGPVARDPLFAEDRASQFVLRQVYEPLTDDVDPPYGRAGRRQGLALGFRPTAGGSVWVVRLRRGVQFSDGTSFTGSGVALNARRWAAEAPGLIPELVTADSPRADRVRFILSESVDDLPDRLADPRLGIVSPRALRPTGSGRLRFADAAAAGTGPFAIEQRSARRVTLERSSGWWGTSLRLGPALHRIEFVVESDPATRFALLDAGQVEIADDLGQADRLDLGALRSDPLLDALDAPGSLIGIERSLRGVDAQAPGTPLSGAWLTSVGQAPPG